MAKNRRLYYAWARDSGKQGQEQEGRKNNKDGTHLHAIYCDTPICFRMQSASVSASARI